MEVNEIAFVIIEQTSVEVMIEYFKAHPEVPAQEIGDVFNVLVQGSIAWSSQERKDIVKAALEGAQHPLAKQMGNVLKAL